MKLKITLFTNSKLPEKVFNIWFKDRNRTNLKVFSISEKTFNIISKMKIKKILL
jgi:hypothetical protein